MRGLMMIAVASAALTFAAAPASATPTIVACGGGSNCLSDTTNVNLTSGENLITGFGTVGTQVGAPEVTFTTTEDGGLDLDASGQATISAGDEGSLTTLTFEILTGFTGAEFNLVPLNVRGGPVQFGVSITTNLGATNGIFVSPDGNQRFAILAGAGETIQSVTITSTAGFGALTQLRVGTAATVGLVPEPGTWAMMLLGFGGVGVAMRRSRRRRPGAGMMQIA